MKENPIYLRICLTNRCNYNCYYCHAEGSDSKNSKDLPLGVILSAVKLAKENNINKIKLTGGEPLLRKDIKKIISEIYKINKKFDLSLTTNGFFLKDKVNDLKKAGLKRINISVNSLSNKKYGEITGIDGLNRVLDGISEASKLGIKIKINTMIDKKNLKEVMKFVDYCKKNNFDLRFLDLLPVKEGTKDMVFSSDNLNLVLESLCSSVSLENQNGTKVNKYIIKGTPVMTKAKSFGNKCMNCKHRQKCGEGIYALRLNADGKLQPCLFRKDLEMDFKKTKTKRKTNFKTALMRAAA
ncbi:radical SAM protein [Candidatus Woesearchaeota archaeon]|nr:radical SAM protein [Candidatus Woesearchaeota archaeon]